MFDVLQEAIEEVEAPLSGPALLEVIALRDRLDARISAGVHSVDASGEWGVDGSVSMASWLKHHAGFTGPGAHAAVRNARKVAQWPTVAAAWAEGTLSSGQVDVVVANVKAKAVDLFCEHEAGVVGHLAGLSIGDTERVMQAWRIRAELELDQNGPDPEGPPEPLRTSHLSPMLDGHGRLDANLDPEGFAIAQAALRLAESRDAVGEERTSAERQADALIDVFRHFLDHQTTQIGGRHRPHVNVVVDLPDLHAGHGGRTLDGRPLDGATLRRLCCDANIHRVITDGASSILDYGRATRTIPPAVYTSLVLRDLRCRFPGCDRPPRWCEGHHIQHWEDGGPTDLGNLVLLCCRHHHVIHLRGWHLKLLPTGVVEVTDPQGRVHTSDPPVLR